MFKAHVLQKKGTQFPSSYSLSLFDNSLPSMYGLTPDLVSTLDEIRTKKSHSQIAQELYALFRGQIKYGSQKKAQGYASAKQVWRNKEGVCGEMSYLYVSAARYCGLRSSYVSVTEDYSGESVHHACAAVWVPKMTLVDIAYNTYDIIHNSFSLRSDREVLHLYELWKVKK